MNIGVNKIKQCNSQMILINIRIFKKKNHSKVNRSIQNFGLKHVYFHLQMFTPCSRLIANVHVVFTAKYKCFRLVHAYVLLFTPCSRVISNVHAMFTPIFPRSRQCSRVHVSFTSRSRLVHAFFSVHACSRMFTSVNREC